MAHCTSSCITSDNELLTSILAQDIAFGTRLSQIVQAFQTANGVPQTAQAVSTVSVTTSCADAGNELLAGILAQRQANFDSLQLVLLAV